jgi:hypothetical protein
MIKKVVGPQKRDQLVNLQDNDKSCANSPPLPKHMTYVYSLRVEIKSSS